MESARAKLPLWLAIAAVALVGIVFVDSARLVGGSFPGFLVWDNGMLVAFHRETWTGARSDLPLNGGRIVAIDGAPFPGGRAFLDHAQSLPVGSVISYRVSMDGREVETRVPTMRLTWTDYWSTYGNYLFNALSFLVIAVIALMLRPDREAARSLAIAMVAMGVLMALAIDYLTTYRFVAICRLVEAMAPAAIAQFALLFPSPRTQPATRRIAVYGLGLLGLALWIGSLFTFTANPELARSLTFVVYILLALIPLAMLASFYLVFARASSVEERVQAAVVAAGATAAFLVPAIAILAFLALGWDFSFTWITLLLPIFPASLLYAVVRHDLLGAERFARLTVGYVAATMAVVIGYATILLLVDRTIAPGAAESPAAYFVLLISTAIAFDPLRRRIQMRVDRIFYRSDVNIAEVLELASAEFALLPEEESICRAVELRVQDALSLEWARFIDSPAAIDDAVLSEPVAFSGESLGFLVSGPKRSGAPFSEGERDLVRGLARQTALALQNARSSSALRDAQAALLRAERLAAIGELAGAVAHGIRNPLAGIRAAAQIADEQSRPGPASESLRGLIAEVDRLEHRVRTLLDFSRPFEPHPREIDLAEILHSVVRAIEPKARQQHVLVNLTTPHERFPSWLDPDYVEEALLELAGNALRSMPDGGQLDFSLETNAAGATIRVTDTGGGIPEPVQARVFDLFFTTRSDGTGMGLATVKKIIERMAGRVQLAESGPSGTTFQIDLPQGTAIT